MKPTPVNSVPFERVVKRGQMYYVHKKPAFRESRELDPKRGRPAIVVSRDGDNFMSGTVEVVYLTSEHNIKFLRETQFKLTGSKMTRSVVKCEQIDTLDKQCLGDYIGDLNAEEEELLNEKLCISLGLSPTHDEDIEAKTKEMQTYIDQLRAENAKLIDEQQKSGTGCNLDYKAEAERYKAMYQDLVRTLAGR
jgi:mRNA-degrading endonuclease toxin of MazEF toxin-antitoxin module